MVTHSVRLEATRCDKRSGGIKAAELEGIVSGNEASFPLAAAIVIARDGGMADLPVESVTFTTNVKIPLAVGVPLIEAQ